MKTVRDIKGRFLWLFITLCLILLLAATTTHGKAGGILLQCAYTAVLFASLWGVRKERNEARVGSAIVIPTLSLGWLAMWMDSPLLSYLEGAFLIAFTVFVLYTLVRYVARARRVTADTLYAAFSGYLLLGVMFAAVFGLLEALQPGSTGLSPALSADGEPIRASGDALYFSFVTLSTLGYGDISPSFGFARSVAPLEAIFGQLYLAALVARLVGLWTSQQMEEDVGL